MFAWALLYKYLNVSVKSSLGINLNFLVIILWATGLAYGFIISLIVSLYSKQFLLKGEVGIILLLSGAIIKEKVKNKLQITKFFKR